MSHERFVYVTYIRTTAEKLWEALTAPAFTRQYWGGSWQECDWKPGSSWKLMIPDGRVGDSGEVLEIDPPHRLVLRWRNEFMPDLHAEGDSRAAFELETLGQSVKLTVVHEIDRPKSKFIAAVSNGWPQILSSLKSLLETGTSLEGTRDWPKEL
ncbi:MAG TPA: SRPBCC family protein [Acetobacteraceae bacterium]|nr:SRPBCC family protein [Acetobacteraceae bacterium]